MIDQALLRKIRNVNNASIAELSRIIDMKYEIMANWFGDNDFDGSLEIVKLIDAYISKLSDAIMILMECETEFRRIEHDEIEELII